MAREEQGPELKHKRRQRKRIGGLTYNLEPPPAKRSRTMQKIRSSGTKPEQLLGRAMWGAGLRYRRKNNVLGRPDFVFKARRVAVFVDGDFWHGKDWNRKKATFKRNRDFWIAKIERNIERDREVNTILRKEGWTVVRFWASQVNCDPGECLRIVQEVFENSSSG